MTMVIVNVIRDRFSKLKHWHIVIPVAVVQFMCGLIYLTPVCLNNYLSLLILLYILPKFTGRSAHPELNRFLRCIIHCTSTCCTRINYIRMDLWRWTIMSGHKIYAKCWNKFIFSFNLEHSISSFNVNYFDLPSCAISTFNVQRTGLPGKRDR